MPRSSAPTKASMSRKERCGARLRFPSDDLTTLRVSFYVVASKQLDNDLVGELAEALMKARRDLLGELPMLGQMTAASTDSDAYLPVHPGAAAFYNGTQESFLDKWGNAIFLAPMIFGGTRLGGGGGVEVSSRWRTPKERTSAGSALCPRSPHTISRGQVGAV